MWKHYLLRSTTDNLSNIYQNNKEYKMSNSGCQNTSREQTFLKHAKFEQKNTKIVLQYPLSMLDNMTALCSTLDFSIH